MKIDLHCHTLATKQGDGEARNVTPDIFSEKIKNSGVKIVAITNHNKFDKEQYVALKESVDGDCMVWPGAELDVTIDGVKSWHLIVVANPDQVDNFDDILKKLIGDMTPDECVLQLESVVESFKKGNIEVFYISHFFKKPGIDDSGIEVLNKLVGDESMVFREAANITSMNIFANHDLRMIVGSDVKDWQRYEDSTFSELRLTVESFSQFYLLAKRDVQIIETLLNRVNCHNVSVSPCNTVHFDISLFNEINVIFGPKGTGKTKILQSIKASLERDSLTCGYYKGSENEASFECFTSTAGMRRVVQKLNAQDCTLQFLTLKAWQDLNPTPFSNYRQWWSTKDNSTNKQRLAIVNAAQEVNFSNRNLNVVIEDLEKFKLARSNLDNINVGNYLNGSNLEEFNKLLNKLGVSIGGKIVSCLVEYYSRELCDFSISRIKQIADAKTDTVSKPRSTGFESFAIRRLSLYENTKTILDNISVSEYSEMKSIGYLEDKGKIYSKEIYRMLDVDSRSVASEYSGSVMISKLRTIKEKLQAINTRFFSDDINIVFGEYKGEVDSTGISSTECFMGLSKRIVNDSGENYSPSSGEKAVLLMQDTLNSDVDAYIFDEPELGLGNSYIDSIIRPALSALGKRNKIVVIATHNANIAVRTLPYATILRVYDNGMFNTYIGNPFINNLINIKDISDAKYWKDESMRILEGSEEAFYERRDIYESRSN